MNQLWSVLAVSCCGIFFSSVAVEVFEIKTKPFSCGKCMTFWIGYFSYGILLIIGDSFSPVVVPMSYVLTSVIEKYLWS